MAARLGPSKMKGIPMIGNATGDTNFGGIAGGRWELTPDSKFLPWHKTLTIEASADYSIVSKQDGSTTRGRMNVPGAESRGRARANAMSGQMELYDTSSGHMSTMWYEFVDGDTMTITDMDATTYKALRTR